MDKQPLSIEVIERRVAEFKAMGEDHADFEMYGQSGTIQFGLWGLKFCDYLLDIIRSDRPTVKVIERKSVRASIQESFTELKLQICESDEAIDLGNAVIEAQQERADDEEEEIDFSTHTESELLAMLVQAKSEGYDYVILS